MLGGPLYRSMVLEGATSVDHDKGPSLEPVRRAVNILDSIITS